MSQFRRYASEVLKDVDRDMFFKTLSDLGIKHNNDKRVVNSYGSDEVDGSFIYENKKVPIGYKFVKKDGKESLEIRGDFWNTGLNEQQFVDLLSQSYQKNRIINKLEDNGLMIDDVITNKNKDIVLTARMIG